MYLATAAEDFTSKVFKIDLKTFSEPEHLATLTGHTKAVTGI